MKKKGFTFVEVLVTVFLVSLVFFGIFGAYRLGLYIVGLSQRKIIATNIAQGEIEKIKNLPYVLVGTIGASPPYASGILEATTSNTINGVIYTIERKILLVVDPSDGSEHCPVDYKRAEVKVSFSGILRGVVSLTTDIVPKTKSEELRICEEQPIGVLLVQVSDAQGNLVSLPTIQVFDTQNNLRGTFTPSEGRYEIPLSPGEYKVVVSKEGYSTDRTYSTQEIAQPSKRNPLVIDGQVSQITFEIDKVSTMRVRTLTTFSEEFFTDYFENENKISGSENVIVGGGQVRLATDTEGYYYSQGHILSVEISPTRLIKWQTFFAVEEEEENGTDLKYQFYFASGTDWLLIPDDILPGNSQGIDESSIDLSHLSTTTYFSLKIKAIFSPDSSRLQTPLLHAWQISWQSSNPSPIPNVQFDMKGEKIIGRDSQDNPVYKFSITTSTDSTGTILFSNLEWDRYTISNFKRGERDLELVTSSVSLPLDLPPDTHLNVDLYLQAQNSLLVSVLDKDTLEPIFSATTTLTSNNFEETQLTNLSGQALFIPLNEGNYNLFVEAEMYYPTSTSLFVSSRERILLKLERRD